MVLSNNQEQASNAEANPSQLSEQTPSAGQHPPSQAIDSETTQPLAQRKPCEKCWECRCKGTRLKVTPWRVIHSLTLLGLGVTKGVMAFRGHASVNALDLAVGLCWAAFSYWIGLVEVESPDSLPWLFDTDAKAAVSMLASAAVLVGSLSLWVYLYNEALALILPHIGGGFVLGHLIGMTLIHILLFIIMALVVLGVRWVRRAASRGRTFNLYQHSIPTFTMKKSDWSLFHQIRRLNRCGELFLIVIAVSSFMGAAFLIGSLGIPEDITSSSAAGLAGISLLISVSFIYFGMGICFSISRAIKSRRGSQAGSTGVEIRPSGAGWFGRLWARGRDGLPRFMSPQNCPPVGEEAMESRRREA